MSKRTVAAMAASPRASPLSMLRMYFMRARSTRNGRVSQNTFP